MNLCPKGHASSSSDYCDDCGAPMKGAGPSGCCPECATPRANGARFCELCQHSFEPAPSRGGDPSASRLVRSERLAKEALANAGLAPQATPKAPPAPVAPAAPFDLSAPLLARIQSLASLCDAESAALFPDPAPPERVFHLDLDENLIGRESPSKQSRPEIPLIDPGASRRHAKIVRVEGAFHLLELGSANGTLLDGSPVHAGVLTPLKAGSRLRLGMWTQILIEPR